MGPMTMGCGKVLAPQLPPDPAWPDPVDGNVLLGWGDPGGPETFQQKSLTVFVSCGTSRAQIIVESTRKYLLLETDLSMTKRSLPHRPQSMTHKELGSDIYVSQPTSPRSPRVLKYLSSHRIPTVWSRVPATIENGGLSVDDVFCCNCILRPGT